jgi:hypothetical protein
MAKMRQQATSSPQNQWDTKPHMTSLQIMLDIDIFLDNISYLAP